jgi:hypothetical protein
MAYELTDACIMGRGTTIAEFWWDEDLDEGFIRKVREDGVVPGQAKISLAGWKTYKVVNTSPAYDPAVKETWDYEGDDSVEDERARIEAQLRQLKQEAAHVEAGIPDHATLVGNDDCMICGLPYGEWGRQSE